MASRCCARDAPATAAVGCGCARDWATAGMGCASVSESPLRASHSQAVAWLVRLRPSWAPPPALATLAVAARLGLGFGARRWPLAPLAPLDGNGCGDRGERASAGVAERVLHATLTEKPWVLCFACRASACTIGGTRGWSSLGRRRQALVARCIGSRCSDKCVRGWVRASVRRMLAACSSIGARRCLARASAKGMGAGTEESARQRESMRLRVTLTESLFVCF